MAKKKKIEEIPKIVEIGGTKFEKTQRTIDVLKPIRDEKGIAFYTDIFRYLLKLMPQEDRDFDIVAGLLSYASNNNGLTDKQVKLAERILDYWKLKGVYDV